MTVYHDGTSPRLVDMLKEGETVTKAQEKAGGVFAIGPTIAKAICAAIEAAVTEGKEG